MPSNFKVAIIHDWLNQIGGAENVLEEMVDLFPTADIFTSIYAPDKMPPKYARWSIYTSFMQRLPGIMNRHQPYMPIYPFAFTQFDLASYDVVVSNKSGFCHGVTTSDVHTTPTNNGSGPTHNRPIHICYCLTPTRFLWSYEQYQARERISSGANFLLRPLLAPLRMWDRKAAQKVHHFVAISREVQRRIKEIYGRESTIIYPPVDTEYFTPPNLEALQSAANSTADSGHIVSVKLTESAGNGSVIKPILSTPPVVKNATTAVKHGEPDSGNHNHKEDGDVDTHKQATTDIHNTGSIQTPSPLPDQAIPNTYYLIVSRLIPYKRIDLAVKAFVDLPDEQLIIVGDGRDRADLEAMAADNVRFLGRLNRSEIRELLRYCKAFIFTGLEDFGIAPVEAMSTGRPVVAFAGGGALDTVVPNVSGELFQEQTVSSLLTLLQTFDANAYSTQACRQQAEKFSVANFRSQLHEYIESVLH